MSAAIASCAARLISAGAGKSGKPCDRFTALCSRAWRVISRITDSVKCATLWLRNDFGWVAVSVISASLAQPAKAGAKHQELKQKLTRVNDRSKAAPRAGANQ